MRISDSENTEDFDQYKSSLRGLVGGIGFKTGRQVGVEVDIMYVQKGIKFDGDNADANGVGVLDFEFSLVINQISIPLLLRFKFLPRTSPYILFGGAISYILSATADYIWSIEDESDSGSQDLFEDDAGEDPEILNRLDYSIIGGAGIELPLGPIHIYFEGRYIYGLANILHKTQRGGDILGPDENWMKLKTILIMAGIGF